MQLHVSTREVTIKLVYYGPGLSGKTTNLLALHEAIKAEARTRLVTLDTADERTLFFDMLPLRFDSAESGYTVRIKLFTVPGQPIHAAARRLVLQSTDGVAFIADSQVAQTEQNAHSFGELLQNLTANELDIDTLPLVIQFNKRDLPDIRSNEELQAMANQGREPVYAAVAAQGKGVVETFIGLAQLTWRHLDKVHNLADKLGLSDRAVVEQLAAQMNIDQPYAKLRASRLDDGESFGRAEA